MMLRGWILLFVVFSSMPTYCLHDVNTFLVSSSKNALTPAFSGQKRAMTTGNKPQGTAKTLCERSTLETAERGFGQLQGFDTDHGRSLER